MFSSMEVTWSFTSMTLSVKFSEPNLICRKPLNLGIQRMVGSVKEGQTYVLHSQVRTLWAVLERFGGAEARSIISLNPEMGVAGEEVELALKL